MAIHQSKLRAPIASNAEGLSRGLSRAPALVVASLFACSTANAMGGVWCNADDRDVTISFQAAQTHGVIAPLQNVTARLQANMGGVPAAFRDMKFGQSDIGGYWLDGKEFRLKLNRERNSKVRGYVVLIIKTLAVEELDFRGKYDLTMVMRNPRLGGDDRTWTAGGDIACSAD
jgi:hypothetical protein